MIIGAGIGIAHDIRRRQKSVADIAGSSIVYLLAHSGQSLGVPRGNSRLSASGPAGARMFESGVWPAFINTPAGFTSTLAADTSANSSHNMYVERLASLVPLAEYADDGGKESPWTGCASRLPEYDTVSWYAGEGSQDIATLGGEGIHLTSETQMFEAFGRLVRAEGREPAWPFSGFPQGHEDALLKTPAAQWKQALLDVQRRRTDLAAAAWGIDVPLVPHITEVMANSGYGGIDAAGYAATRAIMQAQSVVAEENASIYCHGPTYQWLHEDGVHTDSRENLLRGEDFGRCGRAILRGESWTHCYIESASVTGLDVVAHIRVPVGNLVTDTTQVTDPGSFGFEVFDATDAALTINTVSLGPTVGGYCDVTITVASGVPSYLRYAMQELGNRAGPGTDVINKAGARGNLRDSDTALALYDSTPLYNWLCPKEVAL